MSKLVFGFGVNDSATPVYEYGVFGGKRKPVWTCPFYRTWIGMIRRCYSEKLHEKYPTYKECQVCEEWRFFSNFRDWMRVRDWKGKQLDKDLLSKGNKLYSPENCVFVSKMTNCFLLDNKSCRGKYPLGVSAKKGGRIQASCNNPFTGKAEHLGYFATAEAAHQAWRAKKIELSVMVAATQTDERVAAAIINAIA